MPCLVLLEHDSQGIKQPSRSAVAAAAMKNDNIHMPWPMGRETTEN
jgi:hypothetical protein